MKCGNCKSRDVDVRHVRGCYTRPIKNTAAKEVMRAPRKPLVVSVPLERECLWCAEKHELFSEKDILHMTFIRNAPMDGSRGTYTLKPWDKPKPIPKRPKTETLLRRAKKNFG